MKQQIDPLVERDLCSMIDTFVENSQLKMQPFIISGELSREYIRGNQFKKIDKQNHTIVKKNTPKNLYIEKKVFNRMLPIYLTRNGILTDNKPIPGFKPNPADPRSVNGALIGNRFVNEFFKESDFDEIYKKLIQSADVFPMVFTKTGIDWTKGNKIFEGEVDIKNNKTDEVTSSNITLFEGRPYINVLPIYEVFPDAVRVETLKEVRAIVHRRPMHVKDVLRRYGIPVEPQSIDTNWVQRGYYTQDVGADYENHVYVYEYYERPSYEYKEGRYIIKLGKDIIYYRGKLPYLNGKDKRDLPFDCIALQSVPGFLPGITVYSQIIDMQDTLNAIKNRLLEYLNRIAIGRKYAWAGSLVNPDKWTNKPGGLTMLTRFGKIPQNEQIDRIGLEFANYAQMIVDDMLFTAGLSALQVYGQSKSNMRTDGVVDKIAESDSNKLTNALKALSNGILSIMRKVLYLERYRMENMKENFKLDNLDELGLKYKMKDVDPEEIVIVNREFLMQSDQIIEKKMAQANQMGLYNPQMNLPYRTKLEMLDMLKASYLKETLDPIERVNWTQSQREHMMLNQDEEIEVQSFELHQLHIQEHQMYLMSEEILELKRENPDKYKVLVGKLNTHIEQHEGFKKQSTQQGIYQAGKDFR